MTTHLIPEHAHSAVCLLCAKRKRAAWRKFKTVMASGAVIVGTGYAAFCVYQQRIVTFTEIATAARKGVDWIEGRIENETIVKKELSAVRKDLIEAKRARDDARRDSKAMADQMRRMEQALKGCIYRPRQYMPAPQHQSAPERTRDFPWLFSK